MIHKRDEPEKQDEPNRPKSRFVWLGCLSSFSGAHQTNEKNQINQTNHLRQMNKTNQMNQTNHKNQINAVHQEAP